MHVVRWVKCTRGDCTRSVAFDSYFARLNHIVCDGTKSWNDKLRIIRDIYFFVLFEICAHVLAYAIDVDEIHIWTLNILQQIVDDFKLCVSESKLRILRRLLSQNRCFCGCIRRSPCAFHQIFDMPEAKNLSDVYDATSTNTFESNNFFANLGKLCITESDVRDFSLNFVRKILQPELVKLAAPIAATPKTVQVPRIMAPASKTKQVTNGVHGANGSSKSTVANMQSNLANVPGYMVAQCIDLSKLLSGTSTSRVSKVVSSAAKPTTEQNVKPKTDSTKMFPQSKSMSRLDKQKLTQQNDNKSINPPAKRISSQDKSKLAKKVVDKSKLPPAKTRPSQEKLKIPKQNSDASIPMDAHTGFADELMAILSKTFDPHGDGLMISEIVIKFCQKVSEWKCWKWVKHKIMIGLDLECRNVNKNVPTNSSGRHNIGATTELMCCRRIEYHVLVIHIWINDSRPNKLVFICLETYWSTQFHHTGTMGHCSHSKIRVSLQLLFSWCPRWRSVSVMVGNNSIYGW